jgi:hypothetical protein
MPQPVDLKLHLLQLCNRWLVQHKSEVDHPVLHVLHQARLDDKASFSSQRDGRE